MFAFPPTCLQEWLPYIGVYLAAISLLSVIVTAADKFKAQNGMWRVPENTLLLLAALGGSAAMYLTMRLIRHKTKHIKFMVGIPLIFGMQAVVVLYCILR